MGNPARELHETYTGWRAKISAANNGNLALKQLVRPTTPEGAAEITAAARLLLRINDLIDDMERNGKPAGLYRRQFPSWLVPILGFTGGWQDRIGADTLIPQVDLDSLEGFANFLDGKVPEFRVGGEANLREILRRARELLEQDNSLDEGLRMYIHRLLSEIERALDDSAMGVSYNFAAGVEQLYVAVRAAGGASKKASGLWQDLGLQFTAGLFSSGVLQGGTAVLGAITRGAG